MNLRLGRRQTRWLQALALAILAATPTLSWGEGTREWAFDVSLDGSPIGSQIFREIQEDEETRITIEANLDVKFLFFSAYTYEHRNEEIWKDGCLVSMRSTTNDNGKPYRVDARANGDRLEVRTRDRQQSLSGCVSSFAYWKPDAMRTPRLLNSQTGEWQEVTLREAPDEPFSFRGQARRTRRMTLVGEDLRIDLWYADDNEWIALESTLSSGRKLSYLRR